MVNSQMQEMRERLAHSLTSLLSQEPKIEQYPQMLQIVNLLEDAGYATGDVNMENPKKFASDLFLSGILSVLVQRAIDMDFKPETQEIPEELVSMLLPSDGHLD